MSSEVQFMRTERIAFW